MITLAFVILVTFEEKTRGFVHDSLAMIIIAVIIVIVSIIVMACCEKIRRKSPTNLILLAVFTLAETYLVGVSTSEFEAQDVSL